MADSKRLQKVLKGIVPLAKEYYDRSIPQFSSLVQAQKYINDHGSFTLTSGILNRDPIPQGSSAAMVNGALDAFVKAAACELNRGIRINIVSPTVVVEAMHKYADYFPGFEPVAVGSVANAYIKSIAGVQTGQVYCVP